jgi:hypothetical protein
MQLSNIMHYVRTTELVKDKDKEFIQDVSQYANVRDPAASKDSFDPFWTFFDKFVPNVAGRKVWNNKIKVSRTITESGCVTITDEAFTILALENYWDHWMDPKTSAKWTDSQRGNQQFMGWSDEAYTRYDAACKLIKTQRATLESKRLEEEYKTRARICMPMEGC